MPSTFRLDTTGLRPTLVVDGVELIATHHITRVVFETDGSGVSALTIQLAVGAGVIEGEAIVTQLVPISTEPLDQREAVLAFLGNIDPEVLVGRALNRGGMLTGSGEESVGESFLAVLKEVVAGVH